MSTSSGEMANKETPVQPAPGQSATGVQDIAFDLQAAGPRSSGGIVTGRAIFVGAVFSVIMAALQCWLSTVFNIHFFGGIHMPFGSIFLLMLLVLCINGPIRAMRRQNKSVASMPDGSTATESRWESENDRPSRWAFTPAELLTIYVMSMFASLISSPGCDNFFLTVGAGLFYFSTKENGWANLFYKHVPSWFAPGWDGKRYDREVIEKLYNGGLTFSEIPWHAWAAMLIAWSVFLLLVYGMLFFTALMIRRQWLVNEALSFPLVQLPLQMVETDGPNGAPPARVFWSNRAMWLGFGFAAAMHFFKGMNSVYPDWPVFPVNQFGGVTLPFTEAPFNVIGSITANVFLGAIGVAFLLTREVSLSFWFFFLLVLLQKVFAETLGFGVAAMPKDTASNQPIFIAFQSVGAWLGMAILLVWTAREHLGNLVRAAFRPNLKTAEQEPFSPRFMVFGFVICFAALVAWSVFAGINAFYAFTFLGIYLVSSLILARIVVEGGFLYPQIPFSATEWMSTAIFGTQAMGAATLTKLTFMQPVLMGDMRTNVLPGFLHAMKIADELRFDRRSLRRMLLGCALAIVLALGTTVVVSLWALYANGGLATYSWFTQDGPKSFFTGTAGALTANQGLDYTRVGWMGVGVAVIFLLTAARTRLLWFPLHPIGYLVASSYPITRLWFPFFIGWLVKTLVMRFGGNDAYRGLRPFMIGLIFGNIAAMMFWLAIGFWSGNHVGYWPA